MNARASLPACILAAALAGCAAAPPATEYRYTELPARQSPYKDFAEIEYTEPLTLAARASLTPEGLEAMKQDELDSLYARLTAGTIPDGSYDGNVIRIAGTSGKKEIEGLMIGYLRKVLELKHESLEEVAEALWKGKVFDRQEGVLRNRVASLDSVWNLALLRGNGAMPAKDGDDGYRLFPGKVFCGQSLIDSRRESIVIDYLFSDEIAGYRELPDFLAGRRGLQVRDELRMIRPGFYIGRAYVNRIYLLTFTLHDKRVDERERAEFMRSGPQQEDCWTGTQLRRTSAPR